MSAESNNNPELLRGYLQSARRAGCSWGEVDETVRQKFTDSDIATLLAQENHTASLEDLFAKMGEGESKVEPKVAHGNALSAGMRPGLAAEEKETPVNGLEKVAIQQVTVRAGDLSSSHESISLADEMVHRHQQVRYCDKIDVSVIFVDGHEATIVIGLSDPASIAGKFRSTRDSVAKRVTTDFGDDDFGRSMAAGYQNLHTQFTELFARYDIEDVQRRLPAPEMHTLTTMQP